MASSRVSSMLLFLLLLLIVFPHIDKALASQMDLRQLEETKHPDEVKVPRGRPYFYGGPVKRCTIYQRCKRPPGPTSSKGTHGLGH